VSSRGASTKRLGRELRGAKRLGRELKRLKVGFKRLLSVRFKMYKTLKQYHLQTMLSYQKKKLNKSNELSK
jgi:hypothetical protein